MKIEEIDKNFATCDVEVSGDKATYSIPHGKFDLYGIFYDAEDKSFRRMPETVSRAMNSRILSLAKDTAGGRLRFSTDSVFFGIDVRYDMFFPMSHMPLSGSCGFTLLLENDDGTAVRMATFKPDAQGCEQGYSRTAALPGGKMRNYILHFPLYNRVTDLKITLLANARVEHGKKYKSVAPILYYGSSITQGACASRPDNAYQGLISKWNNVDFINLGFSGNAKAEDAMTDYLASVDCSLFVCDYDHNAPNAEYLQATHYRLYERYRAVRRETPILFLSRSDLFQAERETLSLSEKEFSVETEKDMKNSFARRAVIIETYERAKAAGDKNVYFLDGEGLFGVKDRGNCTVDGCHPNDLGFYRMAENIYAKMKEISPIF